MANDAEAWEFAAPELGSSLLQNEVLLAAVKDFCCRLRGRAARMKKWLENVVQQRESGLRGRGICELGLIHVCRKLFRWLQDTGRALKGFGVGTPRVEQGQVVARILWLYVHGLGWLAVSFPTLLLGYKNLLARIGMITFCTVGPGTNEKSFAGMDDLSRFSSVVL